MRILVVDDEELIRNVVFEYARNEGYKCDEAENGMDAIEKIETNKYGLYNNGYNDADYGWFFCN